ncbi:hypothetical protein AAFF_G00071240 [Aldrovandia affinis]|uniref:C-type lectin domain-containing protein n=1 Tax=Aldrovandia affinis TaxID=143900 RepID=A0AAD7RZ05_9TELE|nr:hypothetical protein AAFF_G00071240 [Aldrovandia affinis]
MEEVENYTSLQEFTEDMPSKGNQPILYTTQGRQDIQGMKWRMECVRRQTVLLLVTVLLVSISANIALSVLLYKATIISTCSQAAATKVIPTPKTNTLQNRYNQLCQDYTDLGKNCTEQEKECKPCPDLWLHLEDKCYYFSPNKQDWEDSKKSCESLGSHLIILHSHKQHEAMEKEAWRQGGFDYHYWIGLTDSETEGVWKWVDDTTVNNTYWDDEYREPDNHPSSGIHGEDCAVLDSHARTWFDVPCEYTYKRICEMDALYIN